MDTTRAVVQTRHFEGLKGAMWSIANVTVANRQLAATSLKVNGGGLECLNRNETVRIVFACAICLNSCTISSETLFSLLDSNTRLSKVAIAALSKSAAKRVTLALLLN